jgi:hypothetical protein
MQHYSDTIEVDGRPVTRGTRVIVADGFGTEPPTTATVEQAFADIKDGEPGIDYEDENGNERWAYADQILEVL